MVEPSGTSWWWCTPGALPRVDTNMMMVVSGRQKCCRVLDLLGDRESENPMIELKGTVKIGYFEVDVSYTSVFWNWFEDHCIDLYSLCFATRLDYTLKLIRSARVVC